MLSPADVTNTYLAKDWVPISSSVSSNWIINTYFYFLRKKFTHTFYILIKFKTLEEIKLRYISNTYTTIWYSFLLVVVSFSIDIPFKNIQNIAVVLISLGDKVKCIIKIFLIVCVSMHVCTFEFETDDIKSVFSLYFYTSTKT